jgi:hypothetical protein
MNISESVQGIRRSVHTFENAAEKVGEVGMDSTGDTAKHIGDLKNASAGAAANAAVIRKTQDMTGTLLDIIA